MIAFITSSGRPDLLDKTIESLKRNQEFQIIIFVNEDIRNTAASDQVSEVCEKHNCRLLFTNGVGQHAAIESFIHKLNYSDYYLHLEDDWDFDNYYDWIRDSIQIMEKDPEIIKVLARKGSPHPCAHDRKYKGIEFGILKPWTGNDGITWYGFSWNPGVTRIELLKNFIPFPTFEQHLSEKIHTAGYKVAELKKQIYKHIGDGRSTH